jgi:hypothetical protein
LGFGLWVAWGKGWPVEGEAPAASGAGRRGWQNPARGPPAVAVGGRRAAVQLRVGTEVLWVALGMEEEAAPQRVARRPRRRRRRFSAGEEKKQRLGTPAPDSGFKG